MTSEVTVSPGGSTNSAPPALPVFFGAKHRRLFGMLHPGDPSARRGVIICGPIGYESILCHRALQHLARRLAAAGWPTLRFDYDGTGDSVGTDGDPARVRAWIDSVHCARAELERLTGVGSISLVGLRVGAILASLASSEEPVDGLVLWAPCISGKAYVREMRVLAMASRQVSAADDELSGDLEAAGFTLTAASLDDLRGIDLLQAEAPGAGRALVVGRDDVADDTRLPERLRGQGVEVEYLRGDGYSKMLDEPHFNVVPDLLLDRIVEWLSRGGGGSRRGDPAPRETTAEFEIPSPASANEGSSTVALTETALRFGPDGRLFGILTRPRSPAPRCGPAVLLLNSGAVHHIGVNRMYVTLARRLATNGVTSFRFDIGGLGDSLAPDPALENHPYPPHLLHDVAAAIDLLREGGFGRFIAVGLCSGAYAAFQAALHSDPIVESVMVNPLTFRWEEGMSLETPPHHHYAELAEYKQSLRRLASWHRLIHGEVDVPRVLSLQLRQLGKSGRGYLRSLRSIVRRSTSDVDLNTDLQHLDDKGTRLTFVFAEGDPGLDILRTEALWMVRRLQRRGTMTIDIIGGADHVFSPRPARQRLTDVIVQRASEWATRSEECSDDDPLLERT